MSHSLGVAIESLVAILLMLTIGYCMLLNKRLKRLKADEQTLKATIGELITATEIAERAIGGLKHTVRDVNENLGTQLASAAEMSEHHAGAGADDDGHAGDHGKGGKQAASDAPLRSQKARDPQSAMRFAKDIAKGFVVRP